MIDLHCHLLPGVDDGSKSVDRSVSVLRRMAEHGITAVCLTPHFEASRAEHGIPAAHDEAFESLRPAAPAVVALHRGVELMLDRPFPPAAAADRRLTLGGSRFLLVEFSTFIASTAARNALAHLARLGLVPVLAHPERYASCTPAVVADWKGAGALMQVDATTVFTPGVRGARARALLAEGLADIMAADNHGDGRLISTAFQALSEQGAVEQADLLLRANPAAILADGKPAPVEPFTLKQSLLSRLRQLFQPED